MHRQPGEGIEDRRHGRLGGLLIAGGLLLTGGLPIAGCQGGDKPAARPAAGRQQAQNTASTADPTPPTRPAPAEPTPKGVPPRLPAIARGVPAPHTVAVAGVEGLDWLARLALRAQQRVVPALPAPLRARLPEAATSERALVTLLDFPPNTPSGWQNRGLNPGPGLTAVWDDRVLAYGGLPLVYASVRDRGIFMNWLVHLDRAAGGAGHAQATGESVGRCELMEWGAARACIAPRRGFQVFLPLPDQAPPETLQALQAAFSAHIDDAGPLLAEDPHFTAGLTGYPGRFSAFAWLRTGAVARRFLGLATLTPEAAWLAERLPAAALQVGGDVSSARLLADAEGRRALHQIFGTPHAPQGFAARLPAKGGVFLRLAVAPHTLFAGLKALVPPGAAALRGSLEGAERALRGLTGGEAALAAALSGQLAVVSQVAKPGPGGGPPLDPAASALLVGLRDGPAAEALLDRALAALPPGSHAAGADGRPATIQAPGLPPLHLGRAPGLWVVGLSPEAVRAAAGRAEGLAGAEVTLEGPGFLAAGLDLTTLVGTLAPPGTALPPGEDPLSAVAVALDEHGVVFRDGHGLWRALGVFAIGWLLMPASAEAPAPAVREAALAVPPPQVPVSAPPSAPAP